MVQLSAPSSAVLGLLVAILRPSSAQLIGTLTSVPKLPEMVKVDVTNAGTGNVAVLAWNNVFDNKTISRPFIITDGSGAEVLTRGGHVRYAGITNDHLINLAPKETFTRQFNVTKHLASLPNAPATTKAISIDLPHEFLGLVDHTGDYRINPAANAQLDPSGNFIGLGDLPKAGLVPIILQSKPLNLTVNIPAGQVTDKPIRGDKPLATRGERQGRSGMYPWTDCQGTNLTRAMLAINDSALIARAGINAVKSLKTGEESPVAHPYPWWFGKDSKTDISRTRVASVLEHLQDSAEANGGTIISVRCEDTSGVCNPGNVLAYHNIDQDNGVDSIFFCPKTLKSMPENIFPCTDKSGAAGNGYSLGGLLVHEAMHVAPLTGINMAPRSSLMNKETYGAGPAHQLAVDNPKAYLNPDNWHFMASHSWDLGFGEGPWTGKPCLDKFSKPGEETPKA
ncbi:MAG: hypothetical protein M1832_001154 [Thelocarpon impressellum]|nr:MAG: hypothetical protein M1832_001154 [Thelocarpon impressellum]